MGQNETKVEGLGVYDVEIGGAVTYWVIARSQGEALGMVLLQEQQCGSLEGEDMAHFAVKGPLDAEACERCKVHDDSDGQVHSLAHYLATASEPHVAGCSEW